MLGIMRQTISIFNYAPHYEGVWDRGGITPRILNFSTTWGRII